ncbi:MAG TPA: hypothetical protein DCF68_12190, partial [Cyanothece sp. UBA12306]|nr:hypothetical protein [Cyanothece sp. UBA12306]
MVKDSPQSIIKALKNFWHDYAGNWQVLKESPVPLEELTLNQEQSSIPSLSFYFLLSLSTIIATLGLLSNSTATIIGAMIIAPLMNPIISLAYGIVIGNHSLIKRSSLTLGSGIILTIFLASITTNIINLNVVEEEIIGRTKPTLLDLGVAIAAGTAAGFTYTRRSIANALPGVAIAVALVPPLSVVGIGLSLGKKVSVGLSELDGEASLTMGALILFLTNLAGIILSAALVFLCQSYGSFKKAGRGLFFSI